MITPRIFGQAVGTAGKSTTISDSTMRSSPPQTMS